MRIAVAGAINLVNDATRDLGFARTRDERAVTQGLGFVSVDVATGGVAGDDPTVAIRRNTGGTRAIVVVEMRASIAVAGSLTYWLHNAAIAGETVRDPGGLSNRSFAVPGGPQARIIRWATLAPQGSTFYQIGGLAANAEKTIEPNIRIDADNAYLGVFAQNLGANDLTVHFRWYEE